MTLPPVITTDFLANAVALTVSKELLPQFRKKLPDMNWRLIGLHANQSDVAEDDIRLVIQPMNPNAVEENEEQLSKIRDDLERMYWRELEDWEKGSVNEKA